MADVLEHSTNILLLSLLPQKQILNLAHPTLILALIDEVVPGAGVSIQHRRRLDDLSPILTSLTLEGIVSVTCGARSVLEELS